MRTTFELIKATGAVLKGNRDAFPEVLKLSVNDLFFQTFFVVCDEEKTDEYLQDMYVKLLKNSMLLESANDAADWLNEGVIEKTTEHLMRQRQDMIIAEKKGAYEPPRDTGLYTTGPEMSDYDFMNLLENMICNLPEIHRQTALAFYYDGIDLNKMSDIMMVDVATLRRRIEYIENTLVIQMKDFCKKSKYSYTTITPQRILAALNELAVLYRYKDIQGLYDRIYQKMFS